MSQLSASREKAFSRLFHAVAENARRAYRFSPDLIDAPGKAFLSSIGYAEHEFLDFVQDYVGTADEIFREYQSDAEWDVGAQTGLGYLYANGLGVERDYTQAAIWYRKAAEQGDVEAQSGLGYLYASGLGVERDYAQAIAWHRKAAEKGAAYSQFCLGYHYRHGLGIARDKTEAALWFRRAAEQGNAEAREALSTMGHELGANSSQHPRST